MLTSLLVNVKHKRKVTVHLLIDNVSEHALSKFHELESTYNCLMCFYTIPPSVMAKLPGTVNSWSLSSYLRVLAADILPKEITKVIYLDSDMAIDTDITALWDTDLQGKACAVVPRALVKGGLPVAEKKLQLKSCYFNSGVMVMDLEKFREKGIADKGVALLAKAEGVYLLPDQDILNILLDEDHVDLPARWNVQSNHLSDDGVATSAEEGQVIRLIMVKMGGGILHYNGPYKPWIQSFAAFHPLAHRWRHYFKLSPWRDTEVISPKRLPWKARLAHLKHEIAYKLGLPSVHNALWRTPYKLPPVLH